MDKLISQLPAASPLDPTDVLPIDQLGGTVTSKVAVAQLITLFSGGVNMAAVNAAISAAITNLVNGAPGALDTLNELAAALGNDANFATTVTNLIALKESLANKATDLSSNDNTHYPTVKAVADAITAAVSGISLNYNLSSPATRQVGGINIGDSLTGPLDQLLERILAPYTLPTITNTVLTPAVSNYNDQNVTYNAAFRWVQNTGTPALSGAQLQYRRGSSGAWTNLTTTLTTVNGTTKDASGSVTVNTSGADNTQIQFQCVFTDASQANTSSIATGIFLAYSAPGISFAIGSTTRERADVSTNITGTITRTSPNIALTSYQVQYQVNGIGAWTNIGSPVSISGASPSISVTHNDSSLYGSDSLSYRVQVVDVQQTTTSGLETVSFIYPYFYGANASNSTSFNIYTTGTKDVASGAGSLTIPFGASSQYPWFAVEASIAAKTAWYVNALNNGAIGGGSNLFATGVSVTVTGTNWSGTFLIYMGNYATTLPTATIS